MGRNKYRLVERIKRKLPEGERLIEPFVGSGAVFLNTDFPRYLLADSNGDLINLYKTLQREGDAFIEYCRKIFVPRNNQEERYYQLRQEFNASRSVRRRAALFLFLNRHGYNGLCRYNARGGFNVPFGRYKRPYFPAKEMRAFHARAQRATFVQGDFQEVMASARPGDVVYCDPPYFPLSTSANFTSYSAGGFSLEHQQQLAQLAEKSARRGVPVLISNHSTDETRLAYAGAAVSKFDVQRYISCNGANRKKVPELLALFT